LYPIQKNLKPAVSWTPKKNGTSGRSPGTYAPRWRRTAYG
jgi:hypothetical protein